MGVAVANINHARGALNEKQNRITVRQVVRSSKKDAELLRVAEVSIVEANEDSRRGSKERPGIHQT
jgi:hypothetical protein